jgi:hypothetical protein
MALVVLPPLHGLAMTTMLPYRALETFEAGDANSCALETE